MRSRRSTRGSKKISIFVGAKSERKHFPSMRDASSCLSSCLIPFRTSSWLLYRSFFKVGKSREKGICFEFMLWILNEFLRVFLQGGLTGFRFKLLMNDGVDWVSRFTRLVLCSETRTRTKDGERTTEETKMEGVRNNFSYARSCQGRVSRRWVCENLKYANSV